MINARKYIVSIVVAGANERRAARGFSASALTRRAGGKKEKKSEKPLPRNPRILISKDSAIIYIRILLIFIQLRTKRE